MYSAEPYFELIYLPFDNGAKPSFKPQVKKPHITGEGYVLFYTHQCPFTAKYVTLAENYAKEKYIPFRSVLTDSLDKAKNAPAAVTSYALFYNGTFITNEILSVKKFAGMKL